MEFLIGVFVGGLMVGGVILAKVLANKAEANATPNHYLTGKDRERGQRFVAESGEGL